MTTFLTTPMYPVPDEIYNQGNLDLDALVELSRRKRIMQEAAANVGRRRQELRERGMLGYEDVNDPQAAADRVYENALRLGNDINYTKFTRNFFPETRAAYDKWAASNYEDKNLRKDIDQATQRDMPGIQAKQLPGIGTAVRSSNGKAAVSGRYGVGFSMPRDTPDPNRTIEGKPAAQWFAERAGEQGVSNRYATAVPTGVTDKQDPWGVKPRFTGKAVVADAMSKKK